MSTDWPIQVYSVDDAVEKAKYGSYPFRVTALMAPTLIGIPLAKNEDQLRAVIQTAFRESQAPSPDVWIEPVQS